MFHTFRLNLSFLHQGLQTTRKYSRLHTSFLIFKNHILKDTLRVGPAAKSEGFPAQLPCCDYLHSLQKIGQNNSKTNI